jgi:hypothetical protein
LGLKPRAQKSTVTTLREANRLPSLPGRPS